MRKLWHSCTLRPHRLRDSRAADKLQERLVPLGMLESEPQIQQRAAGRQRTALSYAFLHTGLLYWTTLSELQVELNRTTNSNGKVEDNSAVQVIKSLSLCQNTCAFRLQWLQIQSIQSKITQDKWPNESKWNIISCHVGISSSNYISYLLESHGVPWTRLFLTVVL